MVERSTASKQVIIVSIFYCSCVIVCSELVGVVAQSCSFARKEVITVGCIEVEICIAISRAYLAC
jgi:hypothetical protein